MSEKISIAGTSFQLPWYVVSSGLMAKDAVFVLMGNVNPIKATHLQRIVQKLEMDIKNLLADELHGDETV